MRLNVLLLAVSVLVAAPPALAATGGSPLTMTHSGYLLDGADQPVTSPAQTITFRIYDQSGPVALQTLEWQGTCVVEVLEGYYQAVLGDGDCTGTDPLDTADIPATAPRWLEVTVNGTALLPRMAISPVPVAAFARQSLDTQTLTTLLKSEGTINGAGNPIEWSRLKNVPPGLA